MEKRFFTGFLRDLGVRRFREAKLLLTFVKGQHDGPARIRARIDAERAARKIDKAYHDRLIGYLDRIVEKWQASDNLVDPRDPRDWAALENGGHVRVTHPPLDMAPDPE